MLDRLPNDVDKSEGSLIYNALAPAAYNNAQVFLALDDYLELFFGDGAADEYLDKKVSNDGLTRKLATYAERKIITSGSVEIGTRWSLNETTYVITKIIDNNTYIAICEQAGIIGNSYSGLLEALDNVGDITATLLDIITPGTDNESDENLRNRWKSFLQNPSTSGNKNHYLAWAKEVSGIGYAKVFPRWNGVNTVKLTILTEDKTAVSDTKLQEVKDYIEDRRPPGADVTVVSASEKSIDINVKVTLSSSATVEMAKADIESNIKQYFNNIAFSELVVRYTKIGEAILNSSYITDYENLTISNLTGNIQLTEEEIPVLGALNVTE
jgi:uncharacterized phage protein gp47/JayE